MLCAINIGNTHIALGLKKDGMLISTERYETKDFIEYDLVKQKLTFFLTILSKLKILSLLL